MAVHVHRIASNQQSTNQGGRSPPPPLQLNVLCELPLGDSRGYSVCAQVILDDSPLDTEIPILLHLQRYEQR